MKFLFSRTIAYKLYAGKKLRLGDFVNPYLAYMRPHFLLLLSIYILYSNVNEINFAYLVEIKMLTIYVACRDIIKNRGKKTKSVLMKLWLQREFNLGSNTFLFTELKIEN